MFDNTIQGIGGVSGGAYGNYGGYAQYANAGAAAGQQAQGQGQGQPPEKPNMVSLVQSVSSMLQQGMDSNSIAQQLEQSMPQPPPPPQDQGQQAQGQQGQQPPEKPNFQELVQNISSMLQQGMDVNSIAQQLEASMPKPPQDKVQFSNEGQNFAASQNETQQLQALKQNYAL